MFRSLLLLAFFAVSCEAFVAPATPALSRSVVSSSEVQMFGGSSKSAPKKAKKAVKKPVKKVAKKVAKKPVKKVAKKVVKKAAAKGEYKPGTQVPATQVVTDLFGGLKIALDSLGSMSKND